MCIITHKHKYTLTATVFNHNQRSRMVHHSNKSPGSMQGCTPALACPAAWGAGTAAGPAAWSEQPWPLCSPALWWLHWQLPPPTPPSRCSAHPPVTAIPSGQTAIPSGQTAIPSGQTRSPVSAMAVAQIAEHSKHHAVGCSRKARTCQSIECMTLASQHATH